MSGIEALIEGYGGAIALGVLGIHVLAAAGLILAATRVGRARGGAWRLWVWPPLVAAPLPICGGILTFQGVIRAFSAVSAVPAAERATVLAQGIAEAMNATALALIVAWTIYGVTAVALAVGHFTRSRG